MFRAYLPHAQVRRKASSAHICMRSRAMAAVARTTHMDGNRLYVPGNERIDALQCGDKTYNLHSSNLPSRRKTNVQTTEYMSWIFFVYFRASRGRLRKGAVVNVSSIPAFTWIAHARIRAPKQPEPFDRFAAMRAASYVNGGANFNTYFKPARNPAERKPKIWGSGTSATSARKDGDRKAIKKTTLP